MAEEKLYSLEEVKAHVREDDCWLVINGNVYDVTAFLDEHPGGFDIIIANTGELSEQLKKHLLSSMTWWSSITCHYHSYGIGDEANELKDNLPPANERAWLLEVVTTPCPQALSRGSSCQTHRVWIYESDTIPDQ